MYRIFSFLFVIFALTGCSTYKFSQHGFKVDNDPYYHNAEAKLSFSLSGDAKMLNYQEANSVVRKAMRTFKIRPKSVDLLFTSEIGEHLSTTVIAWKAKNEALDFTGYLPQSSGSQRYLFKKRIAKNDQWIHVVYTNNRKQQVGLIFIHPIAISDAVIEDYLAENLARQGGFFPDKTAINCVTDSAVGIMVEFPQELVRNEYTLLKFYRDQGDHKVLELYTLRMPNEPPLAGFKVCPGVYHIVYTDLKHQEIWSKEIDTQDIEEDY